jgi:AcrR family transcriptional regulator
MLKEHIIVTALHLFSQNGIKKVSMNDIVRNAGVSKRTLYDFFENKEMLLMQILETDNARVSEYLKKLTEESYSALEIILLFNRKMMMNPTWFCNAFYDDIKRYPEAYEYMIQKKNLFLSKLVSLLNRGIAEGFFIPEINFDIIAFLAKRHLNMSPPPEKDVKGTYTDIYNTVFLIFIRGICTDAGRKILERYAIREHYKTQNE